MQIVDQIQFGEGNREMRSILGEPKVVTAKATHSAPTLPEKLPKKGK
jgi:hypothetical protein